jgi:PIN domain nuclease of toxin-antitoxin system
VKLLLDSHAFIWYLTNDDRLPEPVKALLEDPMTPVLVSVATHWELMVKALAGRLHLPEAPDRFLMEPIEEAGFRLLPIESRHVLALPELPAIHGDPFDRMLVAQAIVEDLEIVTGDEAIRRYPVRTIW